MMDLVHEYINWAQQMANLVFTQFSDTAVWRHTRPVAEAQTAAYIANVCFGVSFAEIGEVQNKDRTTVRFGVEKIEARRDHPPFDRVLTGIEAIASSVMDTGLGTLDQVIKTDTYEKAMQRLKETGLVEDAAVVMDFIMGTTPSQPVTDSTGE